MRCLICFGSLVRAEGLRLYGKGIYKEISPYIPPKYFVYERVAFRPIYVELENLSMKESK